jgi:hypothetical protein
MIGAVNYLLSLLALKLTGTRRVSHVDDLAADPGAALFAGLTALPKTTALTSYSYRLDHTRQTRLLTGLGKAMIGANLITDAGGDLTWTSTPCTGDRTLPWKSTTCQPVPYVPGPYCRSSPRTAPAKPWSSTAEVDRVQRCCDLRR